MKKLLLLAAALCFSGAAAAAGGAALPYQFAPDTGNLASLQRGARNFMNYCSGCHSMKHLRYGRIGQDLGISDELLKANLMFTADKTGEAIKSAMPAEQSALWFGQAPPDLTVETRFRGPDWVYNFLMTFYLDDKKATGVNNLVLPGASMPHVLGDLQGWQVKHEAESEDGHAAKPQFELAVPGKLSADEYKRFVADTVNFMAYAAEPGKAKRIATGWKVMLYLFVLTFLFYLLKKEYWKDVH